MITSIRIESNMVHDQITVWNRGGNAGHLTVKAGDGLPIAARLLGTCRCDKPLFVGGPDCEGVECPQCDRPALVPLETGIS